MPARQSSLIIAFCAALAAHAAAWAQDAPTAPVDDPKARRIVEEADRIRFPAEGFQVEVSIVSTGKDKAPDERKYRVLSKGNDNTIVMVTEPATERGQILLMKGRELWVFLPNISQPVRLSLAQRLTGQVANGDLARANFAGDYSAQVLRTETIDGANYDVLELNAVDRSVTYQRVIYWVRQGNSAPYRAEFYSASNRLLKTCSLRAQALKARSEPVNLDYLNQCIRAIDRKCCPAAVKDFDDRNESPYNVGGQ